MIVSGDHLPEFKEESRISMGEFKKVTAIDGHTLSAYEAKPEG